MKRIITLLIFGGLLLFAASTCFAQAAKSLPVQITIYPPGFAHKITVMNVPLMQVSILSSTVFDPRRVDPSYLVLGAPKLMLSGTSRNATCRELDVNNDGLADLVCPIRTPLSVLAKPGESVAVVEGQTYDGIRIRGEFYLRILPNE
jgi:hypothetical protein